VCPSFAFLRRIRAPIDEFGDVRLSDLSLLVKEELVELSVSFFFFSVTLPPLWALVFKEDQAPPTPSSYSCVSSCFFLA